MKNNWPLKVIILLCLLMPLAFFPKTFDQFAIPKLTIFLCCIALLLLAVAANYKRLLYLPQYLIWAGGFFILVQTWQTFRLKNIAAGIFGAYGQSESLLVQLGFVILCLSCYLFIEDEVNRRQIYSTILIAVFFVSIYGIIQYSYGDLLTKTVIVRVKSLLGDPNALGVFLILTLPVVIAEFKLQYRQWRGYIIALCLFLGVVTLMLSFSRAAWLGFIFSFILLGYQVLLRLYHKALRKKELVFSGAVILIVIGGIIASQFLIHFHSQSDYTLGTRVSSMSRGSDSGRSLIWPAAWKTFQNSPLSGYGIGTFPRYFHYFEAPAAIKHWGLEREIRQVHNETLHYLATQGIIGLLSYLGLLITLFLAAGVGGLFTRVLPLGKTLLWSALLGYLVYMQFNYPLIHYSYLFWIYGGILLRFQVPPQAQLPNKNHKVIFTAATILLLIICGYLAVNIFRADLCYRKALAQSRRQEYGRSFANYRRVIAAVPWDFHYRYRYGLTLFRAANWALTEKNNQQLSARYLHLAMISQLSLAKDNPGRYEPLFLLGQIKETIGDLIAAKRFYHEALELYPLNYQICFQLAKVAWLTGDKTEFEKEIQAGSKIDPLFMREMAKSLSGRK